jgi:hypothetical protein
MGLVFPEFVEPLQVWRAITPAGALTDPVWTFITTVSGRIEPVQGSEEFLNNQTFAKVAELLFLPYTYHNIVRTGDGIVDADGGQRRTVGLPENWKSMMPHVVYKLEPCQWAVTV